ncbi:Sphingomyelin phosphodiesterase [Entamoeba marina]
MASSNQDREFQIMLLVIRETRGILVKGYDPTVEDNFSITTNVAGEQVVLDILDTTEVDTYYSILNQQINQSDGFVIAYSITDHLRNKIDLENERQVTTEEGQQLADELGANFIECPAKKDININELFETIALSAIEHPPKKKRGLKQERKQGCLLC